MPAVLARPAAPMVTRASPGWGDAPTDPTLASVWQAVAGTTIGDELLEWPPDVFALTEVILQRSQAYRFALSPPAGSTWPPASFPDWPGAVAGAARRWSSWAEDRNEAIPGLLAQEWTVLRERAGSPLERSHPGSRLAAVRGAADPARDRGRSVRRAGRRPGRHQCRWPALPGSWPGVAGQDRLPSAYPGTPDPGAAQGPHPPAGSSVRALSRNACVLGPGVEARWHKAPARGLGTQPHGERVNYLLLPWPLRIRASDFRPVRGPLQRLANDPFGFFEFAPSERLDLDLVDRMLAAARDQAGAVDVVVLPESAVEHAEIDDLEALLARHGVTGLITGIRERPAQPGQFPRNWVHIGVSTGGQWMHIRQNKHHRWSLDDTQIRQYHLGGPLHPHTRWWEAIEVPPRSVQFVEFGDGVTLASLVCEDLAQTDDVASVIRSVGPMIVVTPLLDGPQLSSRWAARYASVLADDPGSAVLTLTSFGMAQRSGLPGQNPSPVVALWKSPGQQTREISLEPGAQGILLSASIARATRRSFDGRRARRQRQRILRRERPAGPGRQHRHQVTAFTSGLTVPGHAGRRGTHDPGVMGAGRGRSTSIRARTHPRR